MNLEIILVWLFFTIQTIQNFGWSRNHKHLDGDTCSNSWFQTFLSVPFYKIFIFKIHTDNSLRYLHFENGVSNRVLINFIKYLLLTPFISAFQTLLHWNLLLITSKSRAWLNSNSDYCFNIWKTLRLTMKIFTNYTDWISYKFLRITSLWLHRSSGLAMYDAR